MTVTWDSEARKNFRHVSRYIRDKFGVKAQQRFVKEVDDLALLLIANPNLGFIDSLFDGRSKTYRSVVINGLSKLVYLVEDDTIYVVAFWDTRREPKSQASKAI